MEPKALIKHFGKDYVDNRVRTMSNYQSMTYANMRKVFTKYHSHIHLPEMLLFLKFQNRNIHFVHPHWNHQTQRLMITITEIMEYASMIKTKLGDHPKDGERIRGADNLIAMERQLDDEEHFILRCTFMASSYLFQNVWVDSTAAHYLTITNCNLPSRGTGYGPYPSVQGLFLYERDAIEYRNWLAMALVEHPEWFSLEGKDIYFSPLYPDFADQI